MREKRRRQPPRAKVFKKYKHESRHQHALHRARLGNGRFVSRQAADQSQLREQAAKKKALDECECEGECEGKDDSENNDVLIEMQQSQYSLHS